jgi:hypothetical protein
MGQPALCAVLLPVGVSLESRVLGSGRFFLVWLPNLSLEESLSCGPVCHLILPPHVKRGRIYIALIGGEEAPEVVYLAPVENVRALRGDRAGHAR